MPSLLQGAIITIEVTSLSVFFGTIIGIFMALGKMSSRKILRLPSIIYIDFIRGTPLLVQILLFYYGIPGLISNVTGEAFRIDPILAGVIVCSINSGAYVAEIVRAGIKDSSLLAVIGVPELLKSGQLYVATTFASFPVYIGVALVYLVMTLTISRMINWLERRWGIVDKSK
ncbi:amino acid ABC transporter permease [Methanohalophilus sp.]|uniref:amino acid ABC transporter permease n=1 Tax=Methanohalophilus sp. TaxID=1966352 RepID=UPI0026306834|nr:amino acid ABC transporter permease [Methanohalophilus sp.]